MSKKYKIPIKSHSKVRRPMSSYVLFSDDWQPGDTWMLETLVNDITRVRKDADSLYAEPNPFMGTDILKHYTDLTAKAYSDYLDDGLLRTMQGEPVMDKLPKKPLRERLKRWWE